MSLTEKLLEMQEARKDLHRMVASREDNATARAPRLTAEEKARTEDTICKFHCHLFRQSMNLKRDQLLINGSGDIAELLDVQHDFVKLGLLETGQIVHVNRRYFKPCPPN